MLSLGRASLRTVVIVFGILFCSVPIVTIALNTISTGFQVGATQTQIDAHGVCHNVQATDGQSYFVPTNTASEWSAFRTNKPAGVTLNSCCAVPYSWSPAASMPVGRREHAATLLSDGKTLICGGTSTTVYNRCDTYNADTDTWSPVASLPEAKYGLSMARFSNGNVLACGGYNTSISKQCDIYDPNTNVWTRVADMPLPRTNFGMAPLSNGNIIACGGQIALNGAPETSTSLCHTYSLTTNTWTQAASLPSVNGYFAMSETHDGQILICGGTASTISDGMNRCDKYNPTTDVWTRATDITRERLWASGALTKHGSVLICGRLNWWLPSCDLYDTVTDTVSTTTPPNAWDSIGPTVSPLSDGRALYCGGTVSTHESACYIFDPGMPGVQCE